MVHGNNDNRLQNNFTHTVDHSKESEPPSDSTYSKDLTPPYESIVDTPPPYNGENHTALPPYTPFPTNINSQTNGMRPTRKGACVLFFWGTLNMQIIYLHLLGFPATVLGSLVAHIVVVKQILYPKVALGLWHACSSQTWEECSNRTELSKVLNIGEDWLTACRVLMFLSWIIQFSDIGLSLIALRKKDRKLAFMAAGLAFLSSVAGIVGVNMFLIRTSQVVAGVALAGWGYYLFMFGMAAYVGIGLLHIIQKFKIPRFRFQNLNEELSGNGREASELHDNPSSTEYLESYSR